MSIHASEGCRLSDLRLFLMSSANRIPPKGIVIKIENHPKITPEEGPVPILLMPPESQTDQLSTTVVL